MSDKEDSSDALAVILAFLAICFIVVYVILPIGLALLGGVGIIGFISGIFVGLKNFITILIEAHQKLP